MASVDLRNVMFRKCGAEKKWVVTKNLLFQRMGCPRNGVGEKMGWEKTGVSQ